MSMTLVRRGVMGSVPRLNPLTLPLAAWYRPESLSALADGAAVATWPDDSGNGRDLVQATGSKQPLYHTAIQNNRAVVRMDGTDDQLTTAASVAYKHVVAVGKYNGATFATFAGFVSGNSADFLMIAAAVGGTTWSGSGRVFHQNGTLVSTGPMNAFHVQSASMEAGLTEPLRIGQDRNLAARYWNGDYGEILVFTRVLTTAERERVRSYLKQRWATP